MTVFSERPLTDVVEPYRLLPGQCGLLDAMFNVRP